MSLLLSIISNIVLASLLALLAWVVDRRMRRPALARIVWLLALVKLITPPLVAVPLVNLPSTLTCGLGACQCPKHAGILTNAYHALPGLLLAVWTIGATITAYTAWRRWAQFRRLLAHAVPAPADWQSLAAAHSAELMIRCPEILTVPGRLPPLVVAGWRRSRMLLPAELINQLNNTQRLALLVHELAHIKRGDPWIRILELLVNVAYWWLPAVGVLGRRLRACEEACSDAAVVACLPEARRDYARLLLDVVDFTGPLPRHPLPGATAMSALAHELEQRLRGILDGKKGARCRLSSAVLTIGLACAILPCQLRWGIERVEPSAIPLTDRAAASNATPPTTSVHSVELSSLCCPSS